MSIATTPSRRESTIITTTERIAMGCDIHMYVEVKDEEQPEHGWRMVMTEEAAFDTRSSRTFAVLADVHNWDGGPTPIATPRGLPVDVSTEVAEESAERGVDGHSHSWVTLSEVHAHDWPADVGTEFRDWAASLPIKFGRKPEDIRLVFWFDN